MFCKFVSVLQVWLVGTDVFKVYFYLVIYIMSKCQVLIGQYDGDNSFDPVANTLV